MEVVLDGDVVLGRGSGPSKKAAEQEAAKNALAKKAGSK
jgi:dsRNA-specific ribonuclease